MQTHLHRSTLQRERERMQHTRQQRTEIPSYENTDYKPTQVPLGSRSMYESNRHTFSPPRSLRQPIPEHMRETVSRFPQEVISIFIQEYQERKTVVDEKRMRMIQKYVTDVINYGDPKGIIPFYTSDTSLEDVAIIIEDVANNSSRQVLEMLNYNNSFRFFLRFVKNEPPYYYLPFLSYSIYLYEGTGKRMKMGEMYVKKTKSRSLSYYHLDVYPFENEEQSQLINNYIDILKVIANDTKIPLVVYVGSMKVGGSIP